MPRDRYFICPRCAHVFASPFWPDSCEHCGERFLHERRELDAAEELSQTILDAKGGERDA